MAKKRTVSYDQMRALKQYRDLPEEEFDELYAKRVLGSLPIQEFEDRIERKLRQFEEDYDLSDLKFNDMETLKALCQAMITLEDYETNLYELRMDGLDEANLSLHTKLHGFMSDLRKDINNMQDSLKITRRIRQGDREINVINELDRLKISASKFLENKLLYVYCPECKMLLSTVWFLYSDDPKNKIVLVCNRKIDDEGTICGTKTIITAKELIERGGKNIDDVVDY